MKLNKACKIESVAAREQSRFVLTEPYLDTANKRILCTDGRAMVFLPVEISPEDVPGHIPIAALKHARKVTGRLSEAIVTLSTTHAATADSAQHPRTHQPGTYPITGSDQIFKAANEAETVCEFALDAELLASIAEAFGGAGVKIQVKAKGNALVIRPITTKACPVVSPDAVALLMQIVTEKKQ